MLLRQDFSLIRYPLKARVHGVERNHESLYAFGGQVRKKGGKGRKSQCLVCVQCFVLTIKPPRTPEGLQ